MKTEHHLVAAFILAFFIGSTPTVWGQFNYTTNNGTITITEYTGPDGDVVIPDKINGLPVTSIGDYAFYGRTSLTSITIPNSVTKIGYAAFRDSGLSSVRIPSGVTGWDQENGLNCNTFSDCFNLTNVIIDDGVPYIGAGAFSGCGSLVHINIGGGVTNMGAGAFTACTSLTTVTIPDSVESIERGLHLLGGEGQAGAFENCTSLTNVNLGSGITSIGDWAFYGCTSLTSITIPDSVTTIGSLAFHGCTSLTAITVGGDNAVYSSVDGVLFNKSQTSLIGCPGGRAGSYIIPNSVTIIGDWAFYGCSSLTSVTIPDSVTSIGGGAFYYCTNLTSVTIPNSVTRFGVVAFGECSSLTSITIPNSITSIGAYAFSYCTNLTSITIPDSITNIGDYAFISCTHLTTVYFEGNAPALGPDPFYDNLKATVYYLPGTAGWGATFGERPTALWVLPCPVILRSSPNLGVQTNQFGFRVSWATNASVVVEASTTLANPAWVPVSTNALTDGWSYFSDPQWANYPARFYRIRQW